VNIWQIVFSVLFVLLIASIHLFGWLKYRKNPRRYGIILINIAPPGEIPIWKHPVSGISYGDDQKEFFDSNNPYAKEFLS
jgi:hypothetical protein